MRSLTVLQRARLQLDQFGLMHFRALAGECAGQSSMSRIRVCIAHATPALWIVLPVCLRVDEETSLHTSSIPFHEHLAAAKRIWCVATSFCCVAASMLKIRERLPTSLDFTATLPHYLSWRFEWGRARVSTRVWGGQGPLRTRRLALLNLCVIFYVVAWDLSTLWQCLFRLLELGCCLARRVSGSGMVCVLC